MRFVRWNSFTIIGLILLAIGIYGAIKGPSFEFDAGLPSEPREGLYYIVVGALMIVNGIMSPKPLPDSATTDKSTDSATKPAKTGASVGAK
jgi:hypothetical protein